MSTSVIRPGLLVNLKSTIAGGVAYDRRDLSTGEEPTDGKAVAKWETTRVIEDPEEHDRAVKARGKAVKEISAVCARTSFGLLCPESEEPALDAAVKAARALIAEHNATAKHTLVNVFVLKGRIAASDTEAARAIGQEVAAMIEAMNGAIDKLDPEAIREAATKAREMAAMLSPELATKVGAAVEAARRAARQIVKRIEKDGESAAIVLKDIQRGSIEKARIAFLDLDGADAPVVEPVVPAVNVQRFADLMGADESPESSDNLSAEAA